MSFHKTNKSADAVKDGGNSKFINASGIYPVTLLAPFVDANDSGSVVVNLAVDYEGQVQAIYGNMRLSNNDGGTNEIGSELFNKLVIVCGHEGDVEDPIEGVLPIGKKGADKDAAILEDLADKEILIRIQQEYSIYNGVIKEKQILKGFYTADGATASELINADEEGVVAGTQLEKDRAYENNITYKDDLDAEQIKVWIDGGRKGGAASSAPKAAGKPSFAKKPGFAKK